LEFDFVESGQGPTLLFLPGSYSNHAGWRGVQNALTGSYRLITTSLPGYGATKEIRAENVCNMNLMADFVARVVEKTGEPVHLVGHSYGGLTAFASVLLGRVKPLSLITFEGNPIYAKPEIGQFEWLQSTLDMYDDFEAAYAKGDPETPGIIIDFWGAPGIFKTMPEQFREYCRSVVYSNILDWRSAVGFNLPLATFSALTMPTTLARGEHANQPMKDVTDTIARYAIDSTIKVVPGSGHFLTSTHPAECAAIIDDHMAQYLTNPS
jgi:pimeloyl-ACP methyl ester carboxylesterase